MDRCVITALLLLFANGVPARAQTTPSALEPDEIIQPDRPDLTNSAHIVETGFMQIELGGSFARVAPSERAEGTPTMVRIGFADWAEARISTDGLRSQQVGPTSTVGLGNVQLGAKFRLWADRNETPIVAILPAINLPTASVEKGLGAGTVDYSLLLIVSRDVSQRGHIDANYDFAMVGAVADRSHFAQNLASVSVSFTAGRHWNPYAEFFWFSKERPNGGRVEGFDIGAICTIGRRVAIDAGLETGFPRPSVAAFGGVSFVVGNVMGGRGLRARRRKADRRALHARETH